MTSKTPGGYARKGARDMAIESQYEYANQTSIWGYLTYLFFIRYGSRAGVHRIIRLFKKHDFKFTCYAVGRAVELNPGIIQEMEQSGHEIASHNHRWVDYQNMDEETERQHVRSCIQAIQSASLTGKAPVGWYTGRVGPNSRRIVWEEYKKVRFPTCYSFDYSE